MSSQSSTSVRYFVAPHCTLSLNTDRSRAEKIKMRHVDKLWYFAAARVKRLLRQGRSPTQHRTSEFFTLHYTALLSWADYPMTPIKWREDCGTLAIKCDELVKFANDFNHIGHNSKAKLQL